MRGNATTSQGDETMRERCSERTTRGQEGGMIRGREGSTTRGDATTSLRKMTRGRCSKRTTRDVGSGEDDCSDNSNGDSDGDADSGDGESGDDDSNSNSGVSDSDNGGKNNNQLKPAAEKVATAVNAALASILLAS
jgi:hypothetical protein